MNHLYALIMAGGGGTRLWPLSRKQRPKQMLPLTEDQTMFQVAVTRLDPLLPPEHIFVVTGQDQVRALRDDAPQVPPENFIAEPFGQNTAPAVGLALGHILHRDPLATVAVLTADQHIGDKDKFRRVLAAAAQHCQDGSIVTLGITPSFPSTGYGYIRRGAALRQIGEFQIYRADEFCEKPDLDTATAYLLSGLYSWNSGMFILRGDHLLAEYERQQPALAALLRRIRAAIGSPRYEAVVAECWPQMPRLSIDYAVMEGAERMSVIPVEMGWSDIGSWATLYDTLPRDASGNVQRGHGPAMVAVDTHNTLVISDRLVAIIGLDDIVIVDTPDALLVCRRERSQEVRKIVEALAQAGASQYL